MSYAGRVFGELSAERQATAKRKAARVLSTVGRGPVDFEVVPNGLAMHARKALTEPELTLFRFQRDAAAVRREA